MSTFALIHGGGGSGWDWHLVEAELRDGGHATVAVDLPVENPAGRERDENALALQQPWPLQRWPDTPTRYLLCRDDRMFPLRGPAATLGSVWASKPTKSTAATT